MDKSSLHLSHENRASGFSLVEVALAIGIIAFAFVALFTLVPTGLTTFRSAIDISNETWIMQGINSMVETTDYANLPQLDYGTSKEIFYYDEEGKQTDTEQQPVPATDAVKAKRLYAVKLLVDKLYRPDGTSAPTGSDLMTQGERVLAIFAPYANKTAMDQFTGLVHASDVANLPKTTELHVRAFYVARMDSQVPIALGGTGTGG